jgi:hypothetical protein
MKQNKPQQPANPNPNKWQQQPQKQQPHQKPQPHQNPTEKKWQSGC